MELPILTDTISPPGYDALTLRVRINPTRSQWQDFREGGIDLDAAARERLALHRHANANAEQALAMDDLSEETRAQAEQLRADTEAGLSELEAERAAMRARLGRALVAFYGMNAPLTMDTDDGPWVLDFRSPDAAIASVEAESAVDDLVYFLFAVPWDVQRRRHEVMQRDLPNSWRADAALRTN